MIGRISVVSPEPSTLARHVGWFCVVGLIAAYAVAVPSKAAGLLPTTVSWAGVAVVPATWIAALASMTILPARYPRRRPLMIGVGLGCLLAAYASVYWQGWV